ncbi:hypothetical protein N0V95_009243 [Ascochyta clinopodiicola]|nr:hypothetical protein N0V95_009243 [Ascochyta clinopodiicola]
MRILGLTDAETDDNSSWKLRSDCVETYNTPGILEDTTMTQKRMPLAVSDCLLGDEAATRAYLATSEESELFLHGRDKRGDTILIMTARERHHSIVSLLIHHGADVNAVNGRGRSALMEAALWGRVENVKLLLEANVDKLAQDHEGRSALDLAQPTPANEKERYDQCEAAAAEKVPQWDQCRRQIAILLGSQSRNLHDYTAPLPANKRAEYYFEKSEVDRTIILRGPITKFNVERIDKTAAILDRGGQFPRITATSGWGKDALPVNIEYRPSWTTSVFTIASTVGHQLSAHKYDQGKKGRYFASHSEKKLIAYFIEKHVFTPQDHDYDEELQQSLQGVAELLEETKTTSTAWKTVCALEATKDKLEAAKDKLEWDMMSARDELSDADDGPQKSDIRSKIEQMKAQIQQMDKDRRSLEIEADVLEIRHQQKKQRLLLEQERLEGCLMDMSQHPPVLSLTRAVIWSSNEVCGDCEGFKTAVNKHFGLNIELTWM